MLATLTDAAVDPLWSGLDLEIDRGQFLTVLGPNGVGKSTLLGVFTGTRRLTGGTARVDARVGLIPQQRMFPAGLPLRAGDLVSLSLAHGVFRRRRAGRARVAELLRRVGGEGLAGHRVGTLSGGQQQLVRQAQALAGDPELLLADEPLLSLDPAAAQRTVAMLRAHCDAGGAVVCVTHDINPVLEATDRVLYLTPGGHVSGTVAEVMDPDVLSRLYDTRVNVVEVDGRLVVV